jgi:hypothetical protein
MRAVFFLLVLVTVAAFTIDEASAAKGGKGLGKLGDGEQGSDRAGGVPAAAATTTGTGDDVTAR